MRTVESTPGRLPELRHLRYLLALAEERHFGRAAARVGIAQPPFSQQIQQLEQIVGEVLVRRRPAIELTPAGAHLAATARLMVDQLTRGVESTQSIGRGEHGALRLGFAASAFLTQLPAAVRSFREAHPGVDVQLRHLSSEAQIQALKSGMLDVGVTRDPPADDPDLILDPMLSEGFVAVLPPDHRLASSWMPIALSQLADDPFVLFPGMSAPALHRRIHQLFESAGFTPGVILEAQEWISIVGLVEAGVGVSIAPDTVRRLKLGNVKYVQVSHGLRTTTALCRSRTYGGPAAEAFVNISRRLSRTTGNPADDLPQQSRVARQCELSYELST